MSVSDVALVAGTLLTWVALVHILMGSGLRLGELVWAGRQPRLLDPSLRLRSIGYAIGLFGSATILAMTSGLLSNPIPGAYVEAANFAVMTFLGLATIYSVSWGSTWERMLFAPITLLGALFAGWMTFA